MLSTRKLLVQLRKRLSDLPLQTYVCLKRRKLNEEALGRITLCGGRVHISNTADGILIPVIRGLNDDQIFDANVRICVWLPDITENEWTELRPFLLSLRNLEFTACTTPTERRVSTAVIPNVSSQFAGRP